MTFSIMEVHELALNSMSLNKRWDVGTYVLSQNNSAPQQSKFVFGFSCKGIHSILLADQVDKAFDNLEIGLKNLSEVEEIDDKS